MRLQKIGNAFVGVDLIFNFGEAVTFVLINLVIDCSASLFDRVDNLLGF